ncbi:MAG: hypothetical protein K1X70_09715 [Leptospirales bacterium]|nr:hypothetical protein [Leptospirales bacterium]MBX7086694.1 hypothetical protein [Leptospirales bacterium]
MKTGLILAVIGTTLLSCSKKKDDDTSLLLTGLLGVTTYNTGFVAFNSSCNVAGSSLCTNYFGSIGQSNTSSSCATSSGTYATTPCTTGGNFGACTTVRQQIVFYTGNAQCASSSACQTRCTNVLSGTYTATY